MTTCIERGLNDKRLQGGGRDQETLYIRGGPSQPWVNQGFNLAWTPEAASVNEMAVHIIDIVVNNSFKHSHNVFCGMENELKLRKDEDIHVQRLKVETHSEMGGPVSGC